MDNTARNLNTAIPAIEQPQRQARPVPHVRVKSAPQTQSVPFTIGERLLTACIGVAAIAFALLILSTQFGVAATTRTYQNLETKISNAGDRVTNYKQSIGELTSSSRLTSFASDHGLSVNDSNIKQVSK